MIRLLQTLFIVVAFSGCATRSVERNYDNPEIRQLQQDSMRGIPEHPISGQTLKEFFSGKDGLLETNNVQFPSGRAAPISDDGYFLTAFHVVDEGEFFLSKLVLLKPLPRGATIMTAEQRKSYLRTDRYKGRVVWTDETADLAIVKFDHRPSSHFGELAQRSEEQAAVFSAALEGKLFSMESSADGVGNGPFETAGKITEIVHVDTGTVPYSVYESTLVGRVGMSGAPVADSSGRLVGIITSLQHYLHFGVRRSTSTRFAMIDADSCARIISNDRKAMSR